MKPKLSSVGAMLYTMSFPSNLAATKAAGALWARFFESVIFKEYYSFQVQKKKKK